MPRTLSGSQNALWNRGLLRAAGAMDTLIAAYAIRNKATLLHYDRDFDHIASPTPDFRHEWIVPRGSLA
jgi:predicted nucleic acid-binding protein